MEEDLKLKIEEVLVNIRNDVKVDTLIEEYLPIDTFQEDIFYNLLYIFLKESYTYRSCKSCHSIIALYDDDKYSAGVPTMSLIYFKEKFTWEIHHFIMSCLEEKILFSDIVYDFIDILNKLSFNEDVSIQMNTLKKVFRLYNKKNMLEELEISMDDIKNDSLYNNRKDSLYNEIDKFKKEISSYADIPQWILKEKKIYSHKELLRTIPVITGIEIPKPINIDELVLFYMTEKQRTGDFEGDNKYEDRKEKAKEDFESMEECQLEEIAKKYARRSLEVKYKDDNEVFRILGPLFPLYQSKDLDSNSKDPCSRFGGCRLLTCWEYQNEDEDGEPIIDNITIREKYESLYWFTGSCEICSLKIRAKHMAVRMPVFEGGGFEGCYCSYDCIRTIIEKEDYLAISIVDEIEKKTFEVGIHDREWITEETEIVQMDEPMYVIDEDEIFFYPVVDYYYDEYED